MDAFVFTKYESAKDCVLQTFGKNKQSKRISENLFFEIWLKIRWGLFQDLLLESVRITLNTDLHCLVF